MIAVWSDASPHLDAAVAALQQADADYVVVPPAPDAAALDAAGRARVQIVGGGVVERRTLELLRATELIVRAGVGTDRIDLAAATELGILVTNTPDYCVGEVADHTIMLLLAGWRRLRTFRAQANGPWDGVNYRPFPRLQGRTAGIIGLGRIGSAVAARASALGLHVVAHDPWRDDDWFAAAGVRPVDLDELLATSEVISLHLPLTPASHHLLDKSAFTAMTRRPVIVNTARGGLIDSAALITALDTGAVSAACLDVLDGEPDVADTVRLLDRDDVLVTPHVAWYSEGAVHQLGSDAVELALHYLQTGGVDNPVNPDTTRRVPHPTDQDSV